MTKPKLVYFDARGLAEPSRLIFHCAKVDFDDVKLSNEEWPNIKPKTKTGKIPYLEFDGHTIVESYAMHRFLARKFGLAGKDEYEQALVDGIADVQKDFYKSVSPWLYAKLGYMAGNHAELKKEHLDDNLEIYLPILTNFLKESKSGFMAPSGLTWADFTVTEFLITLLQHQSILDKFPELKEYLDRVKSVPELKHYYTTRQFAKSN